MAVQVDKLIELVDHISIYECEAHVDALLDRLVKNERPTVLSFVNAHAVNLAMKDEQFQRNLTNSDITLRDGSGMATLYRWLGRPAGINLNGTDLIPRIAEKYCGRTVTLFGTQEPWLGKAANRLRAMGVEVADACHGFEAATSYREILESRPADLVILGMGMPKQEEVALELRNRLTAPCLIVNGGAFLDFLAGRFNRAPRLIQSLGMEWCYRLWKEPRRLFNRYLVGNTLFLYSAIKLARAQRSQA